MKRLRIAPAVSQPLPAHRPDHFRFGLNGAGRDTTPSDSHFWVLTNNDSSTNLVGEFPHFTSIKHPGFTLSGPGFKVCRWGSLSAALASFLYWKLQPATLVRAAAAAGELSLVYCGTPTEHVFHAFHFQLNHFYLRFTTMRFNVLPFSGDQNDIDELGYLEF